MDLLSGPFRSPPPSFSSAEIVDHLDHLDLSVAAGGKYLDEHATQPEVIHMATTIPTFNGNSYIQSYSGHI